MLVVCAILLAYMYGTCELAMKLLFLPKHFGQTRGRRVTGNRYLIAKKLKSPDTKFIIIYSNFNTSSVKFKQQTIKYDHSLRNIVGDRELARGQGGSYKEHKREGKGERNAATYLSRREDRSSPFVRNSPRLI